MINEVLILLAEETEKNAVLKIKIEELQNGQSLDPQTKDDLYCQEVVAKFQKYIDRLIKAGHSAQDIYNVLQIAEMDSEDNEHFAGMFFGHSPNNDEKSYYYANHSGRPKIFEQRFRQAIFELFEKHQTTQI